MRLSTSTNIYFNRPNGTNARIIDSIKLCSKAGYKVMDMNFHDCTTFDTPFKTNKWEHWIDEIADVAQQCGIEFSQSHSHFYNFCNPKEPMVEFKDKIIKRAVRCSSILGVKWMVIHAATDYNTASMIKDSKKKNIEYFSRLLEFAGKYGVGIAIENLWDLNISPLRRYTTTAEELVDLVDSLDFENVGICWDFEHADIMKQDQELALKLVGDRLKATHVSDNVGAANDHIMPYFGNTNWQNIMKMVKEIEYKGDFTFETHRYTTRLPDELVLSALKYSVDVGNYLISLAK